MLFPFYFILYVLVSFKFIYIKLKRYLFILYYSSVGREKKSTKKANLYRTERQLLHDNLTKNKVTISSADPFFINNQIVRPYTNKRGEGHLKIILMILKIIFSNVSQKNRSVCFFKYKLYLLVRLLCLFESPTRDFNWFYVFSDG